MKTPHILLIIALVLSLGTMVGLALAKSEAPSLSMNTVNTVEGGHGLVYRGRYIDKGWHYASRIDVLTKKVPTGTIYIFYFGEGVTSQFVRDENLPAERNN